jgi:hypothetical protein
MPYIKKEDRIKFDRILEQMPNCENKGELEYCIYYLMQKFMQTRDVKYSTLHDTTYAAQHCADEFRRRSLDIREDNAKEENGDVIPKI